MANNQELQEDFSQDVRDDLNGDEATGPENGSDHAENGNNNGGNENESNENGQTNESSSGRDDDRLVDFPCLFQRWAFFSAILNTKKNQIFFSA